MTGLPQAGHIYIITLFFAEFMMELRTNYLQQDWEDQVQNEILALTLTIDHLSVTH